jgi:hypothetical protein
MPVSCRQSTLFIDTSQPNFQAYHSALNEEPDVRQVGNLSILPIKTRIRGPAPVGAYHIATISSK